MTKSHKGPRINFVRGNHNPFFPHSWLIIGILTWVHPRFFVGFVQLNLYFSVQYFVDQCLSFIFLLVIVLSILWFTVCNYPYSIFKLLVIVLFVLRFTVCNYPYSIFKLLAIVLQYNGQKLEDTIGILTNCKSKDRQYNGQKLEDTIGVITNCKSRDKQYNGQ
jgi:hypothetical protein